MKALASQSASGTVTDNERAYIDAEFSQLVDEVDGISTGTRYNGQSLLDGTSAFSGGITVMVGSDAADTINVQLSTLTASGLGLSTSAGVSASGTDATGSATNAVLTATSAASLTTDATGGSFTIDGVTVTLAASTTYDTDDLATLINGTAGITANASNVGGNLVLTSTAAAGAADSITLAGFTGTGVSATALGFATSTATGTDAAAAAPPADITATIASYTVTGNDVSFDVDGTKVTLSATGGSAGDGVYSTDDIADAINDALPAGSTVSAAAAGTTLTISNTATGAAAKTVISDFTGLSATDLGLTTNVAATTLSVASQTGATAAIVAIDAAINEVSNARANIGAMESRFSFRTDSIATSIENLSAANSAITDTDVAAESSKLASAKVKTQAAVAAATQASQMPQDLLRLLQA
jgi:flagellin